MYGLFVVYTDNFIIVQSLENYWFLKILPRSSVCNEDLLFHVNPHNTLENVHTKLVVATAAVVFHISILLSLLPCSGPLIPHKFVTTGVWRHYHPSYRLGPVLTCQSLARASELHLQMPFLKGFILFNEKTNLQFT